jgi:hypothetical protein
MDARESNGIKRFLSDGADAWNFSQGALIAIWMIPVIIVMGAVVAALMGKPAYKWYTGEDQFAETMQIVFYLTAFIFNVVVIKNLWSSGEKGIAALYMVVLAGLFFMIGEELSWGQRIFGWDTSEKFAEINKQEETNLHNIHGVGSTFKWLQMVIGAYGTFLPLLLLMNLSQPLKRFLSFVIPHYTLIPFFAPMFLWRFYRNVFPEPGKDFYFVVSEFNEVMEFVLAVGMTLFMIYQWRRLKASKKTRF